MALHEFTAYLDHAPTDDEFDALFEAGLDDCVPETVNGRGLLHVSRDASSLSEAIISVVADTVQARFHVTAIDDEDLVSLKTVAERTGRSYESVRLLSCGKRGPGGFPPAASSTGSAFYSWAAVSDWFRKNYRTDNIPDERVRTLAAADHLIRAHQLLPDLTPLTNLIAA